MQVGAFVSRHLRPLQDDEREDFEVVLSATLTLLALIIGFSFSMAVSRYDKRKDYEEEETRAIGTGYLRADMLLAADRARVRTLLMHYLDQRLLFYTTHDPRELEQIQTDTEKLQTEMWSIVQRAGLAQPHSAVALVIFRDERRVEQTGIYTGCLMEPYPRGCMESDDSSCHLLQPAGWLRETTHGNFPVYIIATDCVGSLFSDCRH